MQYIPPITYKIPATTATTFLVLLQCPKKQVMTPAVKMSREMSGKGMERRIDTENTQNRG